jgi:hypothetical protein
MIRTAILFLALGAGHAAAQDGRLVELAGPSAQVGEQPGACRAAKTGASPGASLWQVRRPESALLGGVIAETSRQKTETKYPICVFDHIRATDVRVSVDITPLEGEIDRAGGVALRVRDENNYYLVRANALENNVRLYRVVDGVRTQFAGVDTPVTSGRPQRLQIEALEDTFTVTFDGARMFEARDQQFPGGGSVALWSKADSLTEFANLTVAVLKE